MKNFTPELIAKAQAAKSAEELIAFSMFCGTPQNNKLEISW